VGLAKLGNAGHLYDWGFLLPVDKASGLFMVRVHAGKPFPVLVKNCHLPMLVFPPSVFPERGTFRANFHSEMLSR
jgi:hypothetical protein